MWFVEHLTRFFQRHLRDVSEEGIFVLGRKLWCLLYRIFRFIATVLSIPIVLSFRILRPLILIRTAGINSLRLGHFVVNTELYLCSKKAKPPRKRTVDLLYFEDKPCNQQIAKMYQKVMFIKPWVRWLSYANEWLPGKNIHKISDLYSDRDIYGYLSTMPKNVSLTPEEESFGFEALSKMGVKKDAPFICFHSRTPDYLDQIIPKTDFSYHNHRDSNIYDYMPAAEYLTTQGYYLIRMEALAKEPLKNTNPMIIDYAFKWRTDFLDVFLVSKCVFFLGSSAGATALAVLSRRPIAFANYIPLEYLYSWAKQDVFIPKKLWLKKEKRFMTFREILESGAGRFLDQKKYVERGIEIIDNTPEEIVDLVVEMEARTRGKWEDTKEDEMLQKRFWSIFKKSELNGVFWTRIGSKFLKQHAYLLD